MCNITSGFQVHSIPDGLLVFPAKVLEVPTETKDAILPIIYVHDGKALLGGSTIGKMRLWDAAAGDYIHALRCDGSHDNGN